MVTHDSCTGSLDGVSTWIWCFQRLCLIMNLNTVLPAQTASGGTNLTFPACA